MKIKARNGLIAGCLVFVAANGMADEKPIDRYALVNRHNIRWEDVRGEIPLGNGEFCFNADGTGLQTFGGNTMAHWAWHSDPLPSGCTGGCTKADIPPTGTVERGRIQGRMRKAAEKPELDRWLYQNPHPLNLGRLRFVRPDGDPLRTEEITELSRTYNLWTGLHKSRFEVDGQTVTVETCVHPKLNLISVRAESALFTEGKLAVALDFPYPNGVKGGAWAGKWDRAESHSSELAPRPEQNRADICRTVDDSAYQVALAWSDGCKLKKTGRHAFVLSCNPSNRMEFVCGFFMQALKALPSVEETQRAVAAHWKEFWSTGGAIDLSESKDPRWKELERRIVLSQYQIAAQSAGSWPSAEIGLMGIDDWSGQFHMEMVWWHLAHYALWDRWPMAERALGCYQKFLPVARQLAKQFDYRGVRWGKMVGPEGRTAPWSGSFVLHWQQPHPIFFAELEYRLRPTRATLEKWKEIVFGNGRILGRFSRSRRPGRISSSADHCRRANRGVTRDTVFDLAYWRWGLDQAQLWRERLGLPREPRWDEVRRRLAPLPTVDGLFVHSPEWTDTYTKRNWEHPDPIGVFGMLSPDRRSGSKNGSPYRPRRLGQMAMAPLLGLGLSLDGDGRRTRRRTPKWPLTFS